jgi:hypothetical protein
MRNWKDLKTDEIFAIWKQYLYTDRFDTHSILQYNTIETKIMRLTPMEIIRLVEELIDRLEIKEKLNENI